MNRNTLLSILSLICVTVLVVVIVLFTKSVKPTVPENNTDDTTITENNQDSAQTSDSTQNDSDTQKEPEQNDTPVENDSIKNDGNTENNQPEPEPEPEPKPEPKPEPEPEPKPEPEPEPLPEPNKTEVSIEHLSYESLTILDGKTPQEAYEYLDSFLNSRYGILVNKENKVGSDWAPSDLITPSGCEYKMEKQAGEALVQMLSAARADGITDLSLYSGYRTYSSQKNKFDTRTQKYLNQGYSRADAEKKAGEYIAPPGSSEHHTGLAADICSWGIVSKYGYLSDDFDTTKEYRWLSENCMNYGFILRYRKDAEDITGFLYEPWHYRYIGVEHAKMCSSLGITYEEYHALLVKCRDEAKVRMGA